MGNERDLSDVKARDIYGLIQGDHARIENKFYGTPRKASLFQLPATDSNFIGRSQQIAQIEAILTSKNPTALMSGMGGVGKSTLAKAIGNRLKTQYPDGQLYVDLRGQSESPREPIAVLSEFLIDGFGDDPQNLPIELDRLQNLFYDRLTGRKILVVLDNAADADQVEPLLPRVNGCGALVTSRERLVGLSGVGQESFVLLDVMTTGEAIALLDRLCGEKTQGHELTAELVQLCGRLPLALTIVGRLLFGTASLTLEKLIAELGKERSRLRSLKYRNNKDEIDPKLDVEASFNLSYRQLLPEQQRVFASVAVLRGVDFGVELAAVLGEMEETQVQRRLDQLVALALVEMPKDTIGRYRFHDLVREFGREKLEPEREEELTGQALEWYDDNANTFDNYLKPKYRRSIAEGLVSEWKQPLETIVSTLDAMALAWFRAEHSNLIEAVNWAQDLVDHKLTVRLTGNLVAFFQRKALWPDWVATHQVALKSARALGDQPGIAATMNNLGAVYRSQGKWDDAIDCYQQSLETMCAIGDTHVIAITIMNIGNVYQAQGKWDDAIDCYQRSLEIMRAISDQQGIAQTIGNFGLVYQAQGKWEKAIDYFQQSLKIMRAIDDQYGIALTIGNLGLVYQAQGKWEEAIDYFQQSLKIKRAIGDQLGVSQSVMGLGVVYRSQGKWEEAIDCYQQSLEIKHALGDQHGIVQTIGNLGNVYQAQGKWEEAIDCYQQSIQSYHAIGDPQTEANGWFNLGNAQAQLGNPTARTSYQNAKALYQRLKLTNMLEACDNAIVRFNIQHKIRSFPLWQSAIVLLALSIGWMAIGRSIAPGNAPIQQERSK